MNKYKCEFHSEEWWTDCEEFDTKQEAIEYGDKHAKEEGVVKFWLGEKKQFKLPSIIDVDDVIQDIQEYAYINSGEVAETYLDDVLPEHKKELEKQLNDVLNNWLDIYDYKPNFFTLENVEIIECEV